VVPEILQPDVLCEKKILPGMYYERDPSSSLTLSSGKSFSSTLLNCQVETLDAAVSIRGRFAANATLTVLITRYFIVIKVLWPRYGNEVLFDVLENFCRKGALEQNL
jgi:hypothetical protein